VPRLSIYYEMTSALFALHQPALCISIFKSSQRVNQDILLLKAIETGNIDLFNLLIPLISFKHDAERAGRLAGAALMRGQFLLAHQCLHLQIFAIAHARVPNNVPAAHDVYNKAKAEGLRKTAMLWEIRAEGKTLLNTLPDQMIGLIAMYLQMPLRKNITATQQHALTHFGYRPAVTLSMPDKSAKVRMPINPAD
jgi:hypothetical protein